LLKSTKRGAVARGTAPSAALDHHTKEWTMAYLTAATVFIGLLGGLNLLLILGVIRKLRAGDTQSSADGKSGAPRDAVIAPGARAADFTVIDIGGDTISRDSLRTPTLVGFFSADCDACKDQLPDFLNTARRTIGARERVLAVVTPPTADTENLVTPLADVGRVVVEAYDGELTRAFGVRMWPAFALVDGEGTVVSSGWEMRALSGRALV
jgi:peroxiredoxin